MRSWQEKADEGRVVSWVCSVSGCATLANLAAEWGPVALEAAWTAVAALASLAGGGR